MFHSPTAANICSMQIRQTNWQRSWSCGEGSACHPCSLLPLYPIASFAWYCGISQSWWQCPDLSPDYNKELAVLGRVLLLAGSVCEHVRSELEDTWLVLRYTNTAWVVNSHQCPKAKRRQWGVPSSDHESTRTRLKSYKSVESVMRWMEPGLTLHQEHCCFYDSNCTDPKVVRTKPS